MISIGIHAYSYGFAVVELAFKDQSFQLINSYQRVFEPDSVQQGLALLEHLKTLEKKYKDQSLRFCYGLTQNQVSSFFISLPFKEKFKILKMLPFEIEEKSPFDSKDVFYDARISFLQAKSSKVICFATPKNNVESFLQNVKSLQTEPYLLSVEASALANIIEDWHTHHVKSKQNELYIHVGFSETMVLFFHEGSLENVFTIDWGLHPIFSKIIKKYKLSLEETMEEFLTKSFVLSSDKGFSEDQIQFSKLIKEELSSLVQQLNLLNIFYSNNQPASFEHCFLLGPGAAIKNISAFLSMETPYSFSKLSSIPHLSSFDFSNPKNHSLSIALGLAMEGVKRTPYAATNFLHSFKKESFMLFSKKIYRTLGACLIFAFLLGGLSFIRHKEIYRLNEKMDVLFNKYVRKIMFKKSSEVDIASVKSYLKTKKDTRKIEKTINKKIQKTSAIKTLANFSQGLKVQPAWGLKITYLKIEPTLAFIQGHLKASFEKEFKESLSSLSKSSPKVWKGFDEKTPLPQAHQTKEEFKDKKSASKMDKKNKSFPFNKEDIAKSIKESLQSIQPEEELKKFSYRVLLKGASKK